MWPFVAAVMSASVGWGFGASSVAACMIFPDWQKPHCGTSMRRHVCCSGMRAIRLQPLDGDHRGTFERLHASLAGATPARHSHAPCRRRIVKCRAM